jgi:GTPase SAR1 family protein
MSSLAFIPANYGDEQCLYQELLRVEPESRILLFRGDSGTGKTTLLEHCLHQLPFPMKMCRIIVDFKGGAVNLAKLFNEIGREIGWASLPQFQARMDGLEGPRTVTIDHNPMYGIGNRINVLLSPEDPMTREYRLAALSEALLGDLSIVPDGILLVLDSYEQATAGTKEWIEGYLLNWLDKLLQLRVLIAGKSVPAPTLSWRRLQRTRHLRGVREAKQWLEVVRRMRPLQPEESTLYWLEGLVRAYNGRPDMIMMVIESLP